MSLELIAVKKSAENPDLKITLWRHGNYEYSVDFSVDGNIIGLMPLSNVEYYAAIAKFDSLQ